MLAARFAKIFNRTEREVLVVRLPALDVPLPHYSLSNQCTVRYTVGAPPPPPADVRWLRLRLRLR